MGMLLAFSAMTVRAQQKAPSAPLPTKAAATQQSTPIDFALHAASAPQLGPIDLTTYPAAAPLFGPIDLTPHPATAPPLGPIDLTLHPATAPPLGPIDLTLHPTTTPQSDPNDPSLQSASDEVKGVARWVADSGDNVGLPYIVIDKVNARVFAFNRAGQIVGAAPALLGMGRGDRLIVPNDTKMAAMPPRVRITPAGRFVSRLAIDSHGKELLVLNYDASISLHAVVKGTPAEHRAERLKSITAEDNRISFGCINVPEPFYATVVSPTFTNTKGIVYVLPETAPARELFGFHAVGATAVSGAQQGPSGLNARSTQAVPARDAR